MPHQCLKCGSLFQEGTTTILRGCPDCKGNRFFYTQEPLTLSERERMLQQSERDMPLLVERVAHATPEPPVRPEPPAREPGHDRLPIPSAFEPRHGEGQMLPDGRLLVKIPRRVQKRLRAATSGWDYEAPVPKSVPPPFEMRATPPAPNEPMVTEIPKPAVAPAPPLEMPVAAPSLADRVEQTLASEERPETVRIDDPGQYEIDVRRLLERSPIVVQRDGSYVIHLASLFDMPRKPGAKD